MEELENVRLSPTTPCRPPFTLAFVAGLKPSATITSFAMLSRMPIYQIPSPVKSREQSPIRSQLSTSPLATRKALSQLPQAPNRKHHISGLPEPAAKRPTPAQRAGDFTSENAAAPPTHLPVNHSVATTVAAGPPRFTASTSTRNSPPRGRSIASFSASVGPGFKPPATLLSTLPRPAAVHGRIPRQAKSATNTKGPGSHLTKGKSSTGRAESNPISNGTSNARALMVTSTREGSGQAPIAKGKPVFSSLPKSAFEDPYEHRDPSDLPRNDVRVTSFRSNPIPVSSLPKCITEHRDASITYAMRGLNLRSEPSSDPPMREESPSRLPRPVTPALLPTPFSIPRSRQKSPQRLKQFLTRDTNTAVWDPDDMFTSMERVMNESLGKLQQNTQESSSMKELLDMYKARRKLSTFPQTLGVGCIDADRSR